MEAELESLVARLRALTEKAKALETLEPRQAEGWMVVLKSYGEDLEGYEEVLGIRPLSDATLVVKIESPLLAQRSNAG